MLDVFLKLMQGLQVPHYLFAKKAPTLGRQRRGNSCVHASAHITPPSRLRISVS